jgi:selenocysteine lyase/cysteine desulfurase
MPPAINGGLMLWSPLQVLNTMNEYYELANANVHRGAHALSIRATEAYEGARDKVQVRPASPPPPGVERSGCAEPG